MQLHPVESQRLVLSLIQHFPLDPDWRATGMVNVTHDGFEWNGERYTSLSAIARAIAGTTFLWSFVMSAPVDHNALPRTRGKQQVQRLRCAIYPRNSTEEGLDQDFNSLDAQREACAA